MSEHLKILDQQTIDDRMAALWRLIDENPYIHRDVKEEHKRAVMEVRHHIVAALADLTAAQARIGSLEYENQRLRELVQSYEPDRERLDFYDRQLYEIGRALGCDHKDDGYLHCVTSTIEDAQARIAELERECKESLDVMHAAQNNSIELGDKLRERDERIAELEQQRFNLVTLVIRLCRRIRPLSPDCKVREDALGYLSCNDLIPSPLRGSDEQEETTST